MIDKHLDIYSDRVTCYILCAPLHLTLLKLTLDHVNSRWTNENLADNI